MHFRTWSCQSVIAVRDEHDFPAEDDIGSVVHKSLGYRHNKKWSFIVDQYDVKAAEGNPAVSLNWERR